MNRWEYLNSRPYRVRHAIAAHFCAGLDSVVEIGAYKMPSPIPDVIAIDPLGVTPGAYFGTVAQWVADNDWYPQGVVALGLDAVGGDVEVDALVDLIVHAQVAVVEAAVGHDHCRRQLEMVLAGREPVVDITLQLPGVETDGYPVFTHRRLVVLGDQL